MPEYQIGSWKLTEGSSEKEPLVLFFAHMPFKGKMTRVGLRGLYQIIAEIERQYAEHQAEVDEEYAHRCAAIELDWLTEWITKTSERARLHERVRFEMTDANLRRATIVDALVGGEKLEMRNERELSMFILDRDMLEQEDYETGDDEEFVNDEGLSLGPGR